MKGILAGIRDLWPIIVSVAYVVGAVWVTVDAVLRKRHVPAIIGWVGLAWLVPIVGALAYFLLGINRIRRSATAMNRRVESVAHGDACRPRLGAIPREVLDGRYPGFAGLDRLGERVTRNPLLDGNRVEPLQDGDAAFPAMLSSIDAARTSVTLATYIFDNDSVGRAFHDALVRARGRGVEVRVLIDDVGARYTRPTMIRVLRAAGVPAAAFLPTRIPRLFQYANLRNHRKILIVDGRVGFTGGINIRAGHWLARRPAHPVRCLHFRVDGPVVADMQRAFAIDWAFNTGERLGGERWFSPTEDCGSVAARGVLLGFIGVAAVVAHKLAGAELALVPVLLALLALAGISAGTLLQKRFVPHFDLRTGQVIQFSAALLFTLPLAWISEPMRIVWNPATLGAMAWSIGVLTGWGSRSEQ